MFFNLRTETVYYSEMKLVHSYMPVYDYLECFPEDMTEIEQFVNVLLQHKGFSKCSNSSKDRKILQKQISSCNSG